VESLSSYLCRLSVAHSASVKDVIEHAFLWLRRTTRSDIAIPFVTRSPESLAYYVQPNGMTRLLVEALAAATQRSDLRCGTFLALEIAVSRCMGTFDRAVRWCPQCMREFVEADDEGYMKLQWQLCDVARCSLHGVMLLDKCPHCQRHQNGCARRERVTHCVFCKRPLTRVTVEVPGPGSWKVESADLIEVVDEIASKPMLVYPRESPRAVLTELFDRVWQREEELRLWKMASRDEVLSIIDGTTPISLKTARRLAFQLGLRPADMLAGTFARTTDVLDDAWTAKLPANMRPKRRAARHDRMRLMVALEGAVRRGRLGNPDSLRHVGWRSSSYRLINTSASSSPALLAVYVGTDHRLRVDPRFAVVRDTFATPHSCAPLISSSSVCASR
jgi:hypothetical protein